MNHHAPIYRGRDRNGRRRVLEVVRGLAEPFDLYAVRDALERQCPDTSASTCDVSKTLSDWARCGWLKLVQPGKPSHPALYARAQLPVEPAPEAKPVEPERTLSETERKWREFRATIVLPPDPEQLMYRAAYPVDERPHSRLAKGAKARMED